jgi:hypothetical protein
LNGIIKNNPEQDGTSERSIGIICERTRTAMIDMAIPQFLWPPILETIVHVTNRTATSKLEGKTPYDRTPLCTTLAAQRRSMSAAWTDAGNALHSWVI